MNLNTTSVLFSIRSARCHYNIVLSLELEVHQISDLYLGWNWFITQLQDLTHTSHTPPTGEREANFY